MSTQIFTLPLRPVSGAAYPQTVLSTQAAGARDKEIWAVVPAEAISWHRVSLPAGLQKQSNRMAAALQSLMEERLLDEPDLLHLSLQPEWQANSPAWVAACNKAWLQQHLSQLQAKGHVVHRIVPEWAPVSQSGAMSAWVSGAPEDAWLWVSDTQEAWCLPLEAGVKFWIEKIQSAGSKQDIPANLVIQADPAVAELAQKALRQMQTFNQTDTTDRLSTWRVEVQSSVQRYAQSAATNWDLAQFEFAAHGSARWLQKANRIWQNFAKSPAWQGARWGFGLLVLAQFLGLNVAAWQLNAQAKLQRDFQKSILTQTFPNVTVVDAPLQMAKELERLQRNSGAASPRDLEWVLQSVGAALPAGQRIANIDFKVQGNGETRLQGLQLSESQGTAFVQALRKQGLDAQASGAQWRIVGQKAGF
jgi:general secretion pathway protein L